MARYGANELFNPGGRRRKKTGPASVVTGDQGGSLGSMPYSQAPDALAMFTQALSLGEKAFKDDTKTDTDTDTKTENGNGFSNDSTDTDPKKDLYKDSSGTVQQNPLKEEAKRKRNRNKPQLL